MKVNLKCSGLMAAYYAVHCVIFSYVTYYLADIGISDLVISFVISGACAAGAVIQIVVGRIADSTMHWNWKKLLLLFGGIELAIAVSRLFIHGDICELILYGLIMVVQLIMMPLVNLSGFDYTSKGMPVNYGVIRGVGSAAFAVASYIIGKLTDNRGGRIVLTTTAVLTAALLVVVFIMPDPGDPASQKQDADTEKKKTKITDFIKKYPVFFVISIGVTLIFVYHNMLTIFFIRVVEDVGGTGGNLGTSLAIASIMELPILFIYGFINRRVIKSSKLLLLISCGLYIIRGVLYLFAGNVTMIYLIQLMQGVTYGLMVAAKATYADECMEPEDMATGQAVMTFADAFGVVAGTFIGGALINYGGTRFMLLGGVIITVVGTLITFFASVRKED